MKPAVLILGLFISFYSLKAQQIAIGDYNFNTLRVPIIQDYSTVYSNIGNMLNMQSSELPNKFRFNSNSYKTTLYNLETEKEIYSTETTKASVIYIDYIHNQIAIDACDRLLETYDFVLLETKLNPSGNIETHGILPNIGRFTIAQVSDNNWIIILFFRSGAKCTIKSYRAYMSGCSE